jgi:DNA-directed RNA polymerase subunit L
MKFDINLKVLKYEPKKDFISSSICVELTGKDINYKMVNAIARVASNGVPSYAFYPQLIQIEENTCAAFDNQYLQLRLSNLPIYDLPLDLAYLNDKFWKSYPYNDPHRDRHPKEKEVKAYINYHNNSNEIKYVTTNDMKLYVDGEIHNTYNKEYPILLVKLRPNDTFKCNMTACIGIGEAHTIFKASVNSFATYSDTNYEINLQSNGQETEYVTLVKSCKHIVKRLEDVKSQLETKVNNRELKNEKTLLLTIDNEDHTIGEIINYELQNNENLFSAISKPNHLIKSVLFKIESLKPESILNDIFKILDILIEKYKFLTSLIEKLS